MNISNCSSSKPRVLIVDNNERVKSMYKELITHWGYEPVLANGIGKVLIEDAKQKVKGHRCQLALVDLRLVDDWDDEDDSGLNIVPQLKPAICIIVSASVDIGNIRKSDEVGAATYVGKGEGPDILKRELERVAKKICASKKEIIIEPKDIIEHISKTFLDEVPVKYQDQTVDLLVRLFPEANKLKLMKLDQTSSTSGFAEVPRPRSVILKIWEDDLQPVIVKLARVPKIEKEVMRYKMHIHKRLGSLSAPDFEKSETLWDVGGIKFSYSGNIELNFEQFYKKNTQEIINTVLERFFTQTWANHYQQAKKAKNIALIKKYKEVLDENWIKRVEGFTPPDPGKVMGPDLWKTVDAPEPIAWFRNKILNNPDNPVGYIAETFIAVTHGDLHAGNLLVDDSNNAWVIDFERTGEGHALQDFIELESDLINRMLPGNQSFPFYHQLCFAVTAAQVIGPLEKTFDLSDPESNKLIQTISTIRSLARDCTGLTDIHQYLVGLLFNTLFRATIIKDTNNASKQKSQERALMLASIICHRLDHWKESWPPTEWFEI